MPRPLASVLKEILSTLDRVEAYLSDKTFDDMANEPMLNDAVERCIERVSEASRHIPDEVKSDYPAVPWHDIAAIGNRIRHGYFAVDPHIIWQTATLDLPALKSTVLAIDRNSVEGSDDAGE